MFFSVRYLRSVVITGVKIMESDIRCNETTSEGRNEISATDVDRDVSFRDLVSISFILNNSLFICVNAL